MNRFDDTLPKQRKKHRRTISKRRTAKSPNWDEYFSATISMGNEKRYGFGREYFDKPHNSNYNFERLKYDRSDINKVDDEGDFYLK